MDTWTDIDAALKALEARLPALRAEYPDEGDLRDAFHHECEPIIERANAIDDDHGYSASVYAIEILIRAGLLDPSERLT